jgi:hypothetical protein
VEAGQPRKLHGVEADAAVTSTFEEGLLPVLSNLAPMALSAWRAVPAAIGKPAPSVAETSTGLFTVRFSDARRIPRVRLPTVMKMTHMDAS